MKCIYFSFRNKTENSAIEIAFNVEISPTFVADVFLMLKLKDVKRATPEIPISINGSIAARCGMIFFSLNHTIGNKQTIAIIHLKLVSVIGDA